MFKLYVIYDRVAEQYAEPKTFINEGCAVRWFNGVLSQSKFEPADFDLYCVGDFDSDTGVISALEKPSFVMHGGNANG